MKFPVRPRTLSQLQEMSTPQAVEGGQSEAVPWQLFDTQTYVSAATTNLQFFAAAPATPRFGNVGGAGLPAPQYFEVYYYSVDFLVEPVQGEVTLTAALDVWLLQNGLVGGVIGRPTWQFTLADKLLGPFPLLGLHAIGGLTGSSSAATTTAATDLSNNFANNGPADGSGSFCADGAIVIPPTQNFNVELIWPAAVTLTAGNVQISVTMSGVLHRRVL